MIAMIRFNSRKNKNVKLKEKFLSQPKINSIMKPSGKKSQKKPHPKLYDIMMLNAIDGAPYSLIEKENFQNIIQIGVDKKEYNRQYQAVNRVNLQIAQGTFVDNLHSQIKREVKGKFVSPQLDYGTYHAVPFLGVSIRFYDGFEVQNRLLSCKTAYESHTADNICKDLTHELTDYGISEKQILVLVTDTARNMKAGMILICKDFTLLAMKKFDELEKLITSGDNDIDPEFGEVKDDLMLEVNEKMKMKGFVVDVDCICHVVALAVKKFSSDPIVSVVVEIARSLAKELRKPSRVAQLREENVNLVVLNHGVRWSYLCIMLKTLLDAKDFCKRHENMVDELKILDRTWKKFEKLSAVLEPLKDLTLLLQRPKWSIPDFVQKWFLVQASLMKLKAEKNEFAKIMLEALSERKDQIFDTSIINVAMFFDKRFKPSNINDAEKFIITQHFKKFSVAFESQHLEGLASDQSDSDDDDEVQCVSPQIEISPVDANDVWSIAQKLLDDDDDDDSCVPASNPSSVNQQTKKSKRIGFTLQYRSAKDALMKEISVLKARPKISPGRPEVGRQETTW